MADSMLKVKQKVLQAEPLSRNLSDNLFPQRPANIFDPLVKLGDDEVFRLVYPVLVEEKKTLEEAVNKGVDPFLRSIYSHYRVSEPPFAKMRENILAGLTDDRLHITGTAKFVLLLKKTPSGWRISSFMKEYVSCKLVLEKQKNIKSKKGGS
jgi:hypothetical protein